MKQNIDFGTVKFKAQLSALLEEAHESFDEALQDPDSLMTEKGRGEYVLCYVEAWTKF